MHTCRLSFLFLTHRRKHVVGTQTNRLNEKDLLSVLKKCKNWWNKKVFSALRSKISAVRSTFLFVKVYGGILFSTNEMCILPTSILWIMIFLGVFELWYFFHWDIGFCAHRWDSLWPPLGPPTFCCKFSLFYFQRDVSMGYLRWQMCRNYKVNIYTQLHAGTVIRIIKWRFAQKINQKPHD